MNDRELWQVKTAFFIVWVVLGSIILFTITAPFLLSPDTTHTLSPECTRESDVHRACLLCGMTRSFIHISEGRFSRAYETNSFSIPLYSFFVLNELVLLIYIVRKHKTGLLIFKGVSE